MNVTPVQNNSSLSFGMAFKLKNDGAKALATVIETLPKERATYFEENVLKPIHDSKTKVTFDGENVIIHAYYKHFQSAGVWRYHNDFADMIVSSKVPEKNGQNKLNYLVINEGQENTLSIFYDKSQAQAKVKENIPLLQALLNAKEIVNDFARYAKQEAEQEVRINEIEKKLTKLYG